MPHGDGTLKAFRSLSWEPTRVQVAASGDLAYIAGVWKGTLAGSNGTSVTGKLLEVWERQRDGQWKCIVDTYNSDAPAGSVVLR